MANRIQLDDEDIPRHEYPPDEKFSELLSISLTRLFLVLACLATVVEIVRVGSVDTSIPYNYPLYVGFLYIVAAILVTRRFQAIFDETKIELVDILERTRMDNDVFERDTDITTEKLVSDVECIMDRAFHPVVVFGGGFVGGVFALGLLWAFDVANHYPYLLLVYAYGAGHGYFYGPVAGAVYFIYKIPREYVVDIDLLAPDGVGGYRQVGDSIVTLIVYGVFLVTLDFVALSSASFTGNLLFQTAVYGFYVLTILFLLFVSIGGILLFRWRLLELRERKSSMMRAEFQDIEARYWEKVRSGEDPAPESDHIETMEQMFDRLHGMKLWPINLVSLSRLAFSLVSSAVIAAYNADLFSLPFLS